MYGSIPYMMPGMAAPVSNAATLGSAAASGTSIFSKINWSSLLSNAQKTLGVVNQAIPLYYQVKPVFKNLKALGKIGKEFTKISGDNNQKNSETIKQEPTTNNINNNEIINNDITNIQNDYPTPTFYL